MPIPSEDFTTWTSDTYIGVGHTWDEWRKFINGIKAYGDDNWLNTSSTAQTKAGRLTASSLVASSGNVYIWGQGDEGGQITLGYASATGFTSPANSTWTLDVSAAADNDFRIFRTNASGVTVNVLNADGVTGRIFLESGLELESVNGIKAQTTAGFPILNSAGTLLGTIGGLISGTGAWGLDLSTYINLRGSNRLSFGAEGHATSTDEIFFVREAGEDPDSSELRLVLGDNGPLALDAEDSAAVDKLVIGYYLSGDGYPTAWQPTTELRANGNIFSNTTARAFVVFDASAASGSRSISSSANVAAVQWVANPSGSRHIWKIVFLEPMPNATYAVIGTASNLNNNGGINLSLETGGAYSRTTLECYVSTAENSDAKLPSLVSVAVFASTL